ncbi:MAG: PRC-barrel domain-containing protein [Eggerthellaceae bacterium]|nr:PRC-barrel domain-containing protein [Eggerthellaceae bacterium]
MGEQLVTTKELAGKRVIDDKKGRRIGKVRRFVFHPSEKRCIGLLVKRPDAALMFHRKDLFVSLAGFHFDDAGNIVVHGDADATDKGAVKALGVNWDTCVIWVGMPVMTAGGDVLGFVDVVTFDRETGAVHSLTTENGAANDAIVGKRSIPASYVKGFRRGQGVALVAAGEYQGEDPDEHVEKGAIMVSDEALDLPIQGGAAAAAGKATAVVADKAKKGASQAKVGAAKAKKVVDAKLEEAKPTQEKLANVAGEAIESGTFAVGKQLGKASGMFAAFKEEFDKASRGEGEDD